MKHENLNGRLYARLARQVHDFESASEEYLVTANQQSSQPSNTLWDHSFTLEHMIIDFERMALRGQSYAARLTFAELCGELRLSLGETAEKLRPFYVDERMEVTA